MKTKKRVRPEDVTVKMVAKLVSRHLGPTPAAWEGNCFAVASAVAPLVGGRAVYGHWRGKVSPDGYWAFRVAAPFQRHGWVVLPDGRILDPTRWSFEAAPPYIWLGENDGTYDEGGDVLRASMRTPPPKDGDGPPREYALDVSPACREWLNSLLGREPSTARFFVLQLNWLVNGPLEELHCYAREFFEVLEKLELRALVPIDHWRAVCAEGAGRAGRQPCAHPDCKNTVSADDVCYGCGGYTCDEHDRNMTLTGGHDVEDHWAVCERCGESFDACHCRERW